jgi:hypothetical protein
VETRIDADEQKYERHAINVYLLIKYEKLTEEDRN